MPRAHHIGRLALLCAVVASGHVAGAAQAVVECETARRLLAGSDWFPSRLAGLDMRCACVHAGHMSRMVQVRNVPDALHRKLKGRAAEAGQTLSDYLLAELERLAARPTREEMLARIHHRTRVTLRTPAAVVIREERELA